MLKKSVPFPGSGMTSPGSASLRYSASSSLMSGRSEICLCHARRNALILALKMMCIGSFVAPDADWCVITARETDRRFLIAGVFVCAENDSYDGCGEAVQS